MRKAISIVVCFALIIVLMIPVVASSFTDVVQGKWYETAVNYCVENGYLAGTSTTKFEPNKTVSRAMVVQVIYSMCGKPPAGGSAPSFDDIYGAWYTNAVIWCQDCGMASGISETKFAPNNPVTREQLAQFFMKYAGYRKLDTSKRADISSFSDASSVSKWANNAVRWAVAVGLLSGRGNNKLVPKGTATRAEMAQIIYKFATTIQDPKTAADYDGWRDAYFRTLAFADYSRGEGALAYIDEDDTPEMILYGKSHSAGIRMYTYKAGKLYWKLVADIGISYIPYNGLFYSFSGGQSTHFETIYKLQGTTFTKMGEGETQDIIDFSDPMSELSIEYKWNGKNVSEAEYEKQMQSVYDKSKEVDPNRIEREEFMDYVLKGT